ncbi:MAG: hypothetical protein WC663_04140 [Patescibacteria group bacterium]|jgi:hypothetical protein
MPTCKDCKNFAPNPTDPNKGECYGHEVDANMDSEKCPAKSFQAKE